MEIVERDRATHGTNIIQQLNTIKQEFINKHNQVQPANIVSDDAVYVEFISEWDYSLKFESLSQEQTDDPKYKLLNIKKELTIQNGEEKERYRVAVMMKEGAVTTFLRKAGEYLTTNTKDKEGNYTDTPKNQPLINNLQIIQLATLRAFWSDEPEIPFPDENEIVWWEVWFRKTANDTDKIARVLQNLKTVDVQVGQQELNFPEHLVRLVKGTAKQLSESLILLDNLAELRRPQQLNDFVLNKNVDLADKHNWARDLLARTKSNLDDNSVIICLLDSGVNNKHPLIEPFLPDDRLFTYKPAWGTNDTWDDGGHGTGMGGLAIYGDLAEALSVSNNIEIFHGLESFKIVHPNDPNQPDLYGAITEYACSTPVVGFPNNPRVYCLAITDKSLAFGGRPSTWSAAIDKIAFGITMDSPQLFIVCGGNVEYMLQQLNAAHFHNHNLTESIHDPSQSYNALTVGSYTRMDRIDQAVWPGLTPLSPNGFISPSNSTSVTWSDQWPIKPDIVMEGGNLAVHGGVIMDHVPTLKPLSLDKDFTNYIFNPFGDTSGAAALASKMAAELKTAYPKFWPETIRGLIIHSAEWTVPMLNGVVLGSASVSDKRELLRTFGYGVPIREKLFYSAKNSLTLIAENTIQPYRMEAGKVKTNEYHLFEIPWPIDILQNTLTEADVTLKVTLSYFIDPNPGNKRYANDYSYYSHALDFKMIRPAEDINQFKRRISGAEENLGTAYNGVEEPWLLKESIRNRGSVKKDFIVSSGADLATRNILAVYPKHGWYSSRKRLGMVGSIVRYSLIVSIETENNEVDIYTPVMNLIENTIQN